MTDATDTRPISVVAQGVPVRAKSSGYPEPFRSRVAGREKRVLGEIFGIINFGVNLTTLHPGSESSLLHRHSKQDEFIYIIEGNPTLVTDGGQFELSAGMCAGFPAAGLAHQLINNSAANVVYLEIGDRTPGDEGSFPADDIRADLDQDGKWYFSHKDGRRY